MNAGIHSPAVYHRKIVAGEWFTEAGGGIANGVCAWDSSGRQQLGTGLDGGSVDELTVWDQHLVAGG